MGEIALALKSAAAVAPGTAHEICLRAQVSPSVGRYTVSRMLARGDLVAVSSGRPVVVAAAKNAKLSAAHRAAERTRLQSAAASALDALEALMRRGGKGGGC